MNKEDVAHTHNGILLSHKEEWVNATCSNMDRPRVSEVSQKEKDKYHMISLICGGKKGTNELIYETDTDSQT